MLKIPASRGPITIEGNECSIVGNGDCVIRLDDGASVTLNELSLVGSGDAIGCLGDAEVGGTKLSIAAAGNGMIGKGLLNIADNSDIAIEAIEGSAVTAKGIAIGAGAKLDARAGLNAVHTTKNDLVLGAGAELYAYTDVNYNAVKCADTLILQSGSLFFAQNNGEYHGAEIDMLSVNGVVTIQCKGGSKGMGMFVFTQNEDVCVIGSCSPGAQYENGDGSITFVENMSAYNSWLEEQAKAADAKEEQNAPEGDNDTEDEG